MKFIVTVFLICAFFALSAFAQYKTVSKNDFDKIKKETEELLKLGRYMEMGTPTTVNNVSGWEGLDLKQYNYTISKEQNKNADGELKARVILYNPSAELLVKWVINALLKAKLQASYSNIKLVINVIKGASGAQFPVRGIVYEDQYYSDNIWETYAFFDGVTVECCGFTITTYTLPPNRKFTGQRVKLYDDKETKYWNMTLDQIRDGDVHKYGRIISTTDDEYKAVCDGAQTSGKNWLRIVREEYKKAMASEENNLIYARIYALPTLWQNKPKKIVQLGSCEK